MASLTIEERTGNAGTDRTIELLGAALPFQGAAWGGSLRVRTTFNPGNPQGTQHVLGPEEIPSDWNGEWNTPRLIAAPSRFNDPEKGVQDQRVVSPETLMKILEEIFRGGALLRVTFAAAYGMKIVRLGRATDWNFQVSRATDVKWSTTFEWVGRGDTTQASANFAENDILANSRDANLKAGRIALLAATADLRADRDALAATALANQAPELTLEGILGLASAPLEVLDRVGAKFKQYETRLVFLGGELRKTGATLANYDTALSERAADIGDGMAQTATVLERQMTQQPPEVLVEHSNVGKILVSMNYMNGSYEATVEAGESGRTLAQSSRRQTNAFKPQLLSRNAANQLLARDTITVYIPRATDTMVSISLRYYGTDEHAGALARVNGLPAETITPPRIALVVPILSSIQQQSVGAY